MQTLEKTLLDIWISDKDFKAFLTVSYKVKQICYIALQGIHTSEEKNYLYLKAFMWMFCRFVRNCLKLEATDMPLKWVIDKQTVVYTWNRLLLSNKNEWSIETCNNMD